MTERYRGGLESFEGQAMGTVPVSELKGRAVLSVSGGEKLGQVADVLVDRENLRVAGVVISKGTLLDKERRFLPAEAVSTWGRDAILVKDADVFRSEANLPEREKWVSALDKIKGLAMVSTTGDRIGRVDDLVIDGEGRITAYRVSEGTFGGNAREIEARETKSIGPDAVIVERSRLDPDRTDIP
jgi:uncharacterized protein YrrD